MSLDQLKKILAILGLVAIAVLVAWASYSERQPAKKQQQDPPARVSVQQGRTVITLDPATQKRIGITVAPLRTISYREEQRAYGMVLELQSLVALRRNLIDLRRNLADLRNGYAAAEAQVEKTRASLEVSSKQYERLKALYEDNRNISEKSLQAEEALWQSDKANARAAEIALQAAREGVRAAEEALQVLKDAARQQWGAVLADWLFEAPPAFEQLVQQKDVLIQITLPSGERMASAPETAWVQTAAGTRLPVHFISPSPRTDPRIQGMSFFYLARTEAGILSGMNVVAYLPTGPEVSGFFIPGSAIVYLGGKAWAYLKKDPEQFDRRRVSTGNPARDGYFEKRDFKAGEQIVTRGAQLLLSIELNSPLQGGQGEGQD
jgi:hypothetical protein